jgi:hypothetical protein
MSPGASQEGSANREWIARQPQMSGGPYDRERAALRTRRLDLGDARPVQSGASRPRHDPGLPGGLQSQAERRCSAV